MPPGDHLLEFAITAFVLIVVPGPSVLFVVSRGVALGRKAALATVAGNTAGVMVQAILVALGLGAVVEHSDAAFTAVKLVGAAYLVYLGVTMLRGSLREAPASTSALPRASSWRVFSQGMITNVLNPKVALFFLAFLPQFIAPDAPNKVLAFLFLGVVFNFNATLWNLFLAWSSGGIGRRFRAGTSAARWLDRAVGGLFIGLGVKLALSRAD